jgi:actin-related protein 6
MSFPPVLILDNGAHTIKAGIAGDPLYVEPRLFPNSIVRSKGDKKTYVADEIERCRDYGGLQYRRPFERVSVGGILPFALVICTDCGICGDRVC